MHENYNDPVFQDVNMEKLCESHHVCPPPPPPPECGCEQTPVIVERIKKPILNPDGTFSRRYYYQYPITTFRAVHAGDSIHSPTLDDVLNKWKRILDSKQNKIENGDPNTILTRGIQDGVLGSLTKIDYVDNDRRSKTHVPSEHAMFKALDQQTVSYRGLVDKETVRATGAEDAITEELHHEVARAKDTEEQIENKIKELDENVVHSDIAGEFGTIIKEVKMNSDDLREIGVTVSRLSLMNGNTGTETTKFDLMSPVEEMVDEKISEMEKKSTKVDQSIFENVDNSVVVKTEFTPGNGNTIGRLSVTRKNVTGVGEDITKLVAFKSDDVTINVNEVSTNETEITMSMKTANTDELMDQIRALYA